VAQQLQQSCGNSQPCAVRLMKGGDIVAQKMGGMSKAALAAQIAHLSL